MTKIEKDAVASVHYTGTLPESGEVFDSSEGRDPLTFLVGHKQMIPGFEEELMGAEKGERRTFTLDPERAYGEKIPEAIQQIPSEMFGEITPEPGMTLMSDVGPFNVVSVKEILLRLTSITNLLERLSNLVSKLSMCEQQQKKRLLMVMLMVLATQSLKCEAS